MSKINLVYPKNFVKDVKALFPEHTALDKALENNKYSVGVHLEREVEKLKTTSDEIISSIELGIPSREALRERDTIRKTVEGLYFQWITLIEEALDEQEGKEERITVSGKSRSK